MMTSSSLKMWCMLVVVMCSGGVSGVVQAVEGDATTTTHGCGEAVHQLIHMGVAPQNLMDNLPSNVSSAACSGGQCCTEEVYATLQQEQHGAALIQHALRSAAHSLSSAIAAHHAALAGAVSDALTESERVTLQVFSTSYTRLTPRVQPVIHALYVGLQEAIDNNHHHHHAPKTASSPAVLEELLTRFWDDLFPVVYHSALHVKMPPFTQSYSECVRDARKTVRPWGIVPALVNDPLGRLVDAAKLMLHALHTASKTTVAARDFVLPPECQVAAARMSTCGLCHGVTEPPCHDLCLNVARGCLAPLAEIGAGWSDMVNGVARAGRALKAARPVLDRLSDHLPDAVLVAMETGPKLQKKIRRECGPPTHETTGIATNEITHGEHSKNLVAQSNILVKSPGAQDGGHESATAKKENGGDASVIEEANGDGLAGASDGGVVANTVGSAGAHSKWRGEVLVKQIVKDMYVTREWWQNLANMLCNNVSSSNHTNERCWNGEQLGTYSREVAGVGVSAQKYNPEVQISSPDSSVYAKADTLRAVKREILAHITWLPEADSYTRNSHGGSHGGYDGHYEKSGNFPDGGSGSYLAPDDEDSAFDGSGYGSGDGIPETEIESIRNTDVHSVNQKPPVGGAASVSASLLGYTVLMPMVAVFLIRQQ
uniref:Glypican-5-like n=1 Tax=Hirondellea gigas TaxID=1518452 RepID=A0A2P2I8J7_9CRUS